MCMPLVGPSLHMLGPLLRLASGPMVMRRMIISRSTRQNTPIRYRHTFLWEVLLGVRLNNARVFSNAIPK